MKLNETHKIIIAATSIVIIGVGAAVITHAVRRKLWTQGKKPKGDEVFNPEKQNKVAYVGEQGYTYVRSTPEIKEVSASIGTWWDTLGLSTTEMLQYVSKNTNKIGKISFGKIGIITGQAQDAEGHLWYKVQLAQPLKGKTQGWVREDVIFIQFENK